MSEALMRFIAERAEKEKAGTVSPFDRTEETALLMFDEWLVDNGYLK